MRLRILSLERGSDLHGNELVIFVGKNDHGTRQLVDIRYRPDMGKKLGKITPGTLVEIHLGTRRVDILDGEGQILESIDNLDRT